MDNTTAHKSIVLFDGVCNFCNTTINFLIAHDKNDRLRFASLQSEVADQLIEKTGYKKKRPDSLCLIEDGKIYFRSTAALRIAKKLDGLWPAAYGLVIVPPFLRDAAYDIIARNRYRWFGKMDNCRIPTAEEKKKFI